MRPCSNRVSTTELTVDAGIVNPTPRANPVVLIPITLPSISMRAPPEKPMKMETSGRIKRSLSPPRHVRHLSPSALIMPTLREFPQLPLSGCQPPDRCGPWLLLDRYRVLDQLLSEEPRGLYLDRVQ